MKNFNLDTKNINHQFRNCVIPRELNTALESVFCVYNGDDKAEFSGWVTARRFLGATQNSAFFIAYSKEALMCKIIEFKGKANLSKQTAKFILSATSQEADSRLRFLGNIADKLSTINDQIVEYANLIMDLKGEINTAEPGSLLFGISDRIDLLYKEITDEINLEVN